jgi:hypothetical protein
MFQIFLTTIIGRLILNGVYESNNNNNRRRKKERLRQEMIIIMTIIIILQLYTKKSYIENYYSGTLKQKKFFHMHGFL